MAVARRPLETKTVGKTLAHDSAALSDLMRGQRALERALADAGIDLADNGVRFELARDNGSGSASQQLAKARITWTLPAFHRQQLINIQAFPSPIPALYRKVSLSNRRSP